MISPKWTARQHEISRETIEKANAEGGLDITLESMSLITGDPHAQMPATGVSWFELSIMALLVKRRPQSSLQLPR